MLSTIQLVQSRSNYVTWCRGEVKCVLVWLAFGLLVGFIKLACLEFTPLEATQT